MNTSLVSVILPFRNSEKFIIRSVESILQQTHKNLELILIDDGSVDSSLDLIIENKSDRIILVRNENSLGISRCLNQGLSIAKGDFIARMDSDDIAVFDRIEKQLEFLNAHSNVDLCGSDVILIDALENEIGYMKSATNITYSLMFSTAIWHPTVMFRKYLFTSGLFSYNEKNLFCEDYELWTKLSIEHVNFRNIHEPLLFYRVHAGQSNNSSFESKRFFLSVQRGYIRHLVKVKNTNYLLFFWGFVKSLTNHFKYLVVFKSIRF